MAQPNVYQSRFSPLRISEGCNAVLSYAQHLQEYRVEFLRRLEGDPMAGTGDGMELGFGLNAAQQFRTLLQVRPDIDVLFAPDAVEPRSEERRVGKECSSTWRSRWSQYN